MEPSYGGEEVTYGGVSAEYGPVAWRAGSSNASGDWTAGGDYTGIAPVNAASTIRTQGAAAILAKPRIAAVSQVTVQGSAAVNAVVGPYWRAGSSSAAVDWAVAGNKLLVGAGEIVALARTGVQSAAQLQAQPRGAALARTDATGSATLIAWASVVIADPIDYGVGSIFHPLNWQTGTPKAGDIVYFDPADGFTIDSHGLVSASLNSRSWAAQYDDGTGPQRFEVAFYAWAAVSLTDPKSIATINIQPRIAAVAQIGTGGSANIGVAGVLAIAATSATGVQGTASATARPLSAATTATGVQGAASTSGAPGIATTSQTGMQGAASAAVLPAVPIAAVAQTSMQGAASIQVRARIGATSKTGTKGRARLRRLDGNGTPPIGTCGYQMGIGLGIDLTLTEAA